MNEPSTSSGVTSCSLLSRARLQDDDAWRRLVELYSPLVFHWCRQSGFDSHSAADILQETFQSVYKSLGTFDRVREGSFRSWLWTIVRNKLRDAARKADPTGEGGSSAQQRWQELAEPSDGSSTVHDHGFLHRALETVRGDFQEKSWQAFLAVVIEQRPAREVAAELGLSLGAVYQARARVLRRLNEELGDLEEWPQTVSSE